MKLRPRVAVAFGLHAPYSSRSSPLIFSSSLPVVVIHESKQREAIVGAICRTTKYLAARGCRDLSRPASLIKATGSCFPRNGSSDITAAISLRWGEHSPVNTGRHVSRPSCNAASDSDSVRGKIRSLRARDSLIATCATGNFLPPVIGIYLPSCVPAEKRPGALEISLLQVAIARIAVRWSRSLRDFGIQENFVFSNKIRRFRRAAARLSNGAKKIVA